MQAQWIMRFHEAGIMTYRLTVLGVAVECDTSRDAAELIREFSRESASANGSSKGRPENAPAAVSGNVQTLAGSMEQLWGAADGQEKRFLRLVGTWEDAHVEVSDLAGAMELSIGQLGWVRRRLDAKAEARRVDLAVFFEPEKRLVDGKHRTFYVRRRPLREFIANLPADDATGAD